MDREMPYHRAMEVCEPTVGGNPYMPVQVLVQKEHPDGTTDDEQFPRPVCTFVVVDHSTESVVYTSRKTQRDGVGAPIDEEAIYALGVAEGYSEAQDG